MTRQLEDVRELVESLRGELTESSDRLSLDVWNRALAQVLKNQLCILERLHQCESQLESLTLNLSRDLSERRTTAQQDGSKPEGSVVKAEPSAASASFNAVKDRALFQILSEVDEDLEQEDERKDDDAPEDEVSQAVAGSKNGNQRDKTPIERAIEDVLEEDSEEDLEDDDLFQESLDPRDNPKDPSETSATAEASAELTAKVVKVDIRSVSQSVLQDAVRAFDKRDNMFERGLKKLNDWLACPSGGPGLPYQLRPQRNYAYLNTTGLTDEKILEREGRLIEYFQYSHRLGRLDHAEIRGEVWLYRK